MSWYRLGGFSAYFSVPSGRRWNHSGCSFSHGWSGEHWIAKSSAISIPTFFASVTSARNSFPAFLPADRPRAADVALLRRLGVVPALAVRLPDRVDRRQVEDVEAEVGEARQELAHAGEAAPRAREELVPRAEAAEHAVDVHRVRRRPRLLGARAGRRGERLLDGQLLGVQQHSTLRELAAEIGLAGRHLASQLLLERGDAVDPRLDPEAPGTRPADLEGAGPDVVPERLEGRLAPTGRVGALVPNRGAERLVPVAEDPGGHLDTVAGGALDRVAAAVDLRRDLLDLDPRGSALRDGHAPKSH
jgi:hypothetical protein